jgi:deoxyribodipyrimidine photo-lyase
MAWREYFNEVWQKRHSNLLLPVKSDFTQDYRQGIPAAFLNSTTGIKALDQGIAQLQQDGYIHNHLRLYLAMLWIHYARCTWQEGGRWMYYHLNDHDPASNFFSWQWVAGCFSSKKYLANQSGINHFTQSIQKGSFLEHEPGAAIPESLEPLMQIELKTILPPKIQPTINPSVPTLLYSPFSLNPDWRAKQEANRILVLDPLMFEKYPVSDRVLRWIMDLAGSIQDMQVFAGKPRELTVKTGGEIYYIRHPLNLNFPGKAESLPELFPFPTDASGSFFRYWKSVEKGLKKN